MKGLETSKIKSWFASLRKKEYILLVVFIAVLAILLWYWSAGKTTSLTKTQNSSVEYEDLTSVKAYSEFVEHRLEQVLSSIKGAGKAKVFVVVESGVTLITEDSAHKEDDEKNSSIWGSSSSSVHNYVIQQKAPVLKGILIVCEGAKDVRLKLLISQAISAIFDISEAHISILEGTNI